MTTDRTPQRGEWLEGPWTNEPDRVEFQHAGRACILNRGPVGAWCGYASVPPGHPLHGRPYDSPWGDDPPGPKGANEYVQAHGGLTYASECQGAICHTPAPGQPDNVWWFGFDCAHAGDLCPSMAALRARPDWPKITTLDRHGKPYETYKDLDFVRAETERLAEQLAALEAAP